MTLEDLFSQYTEYSLTNDGFFFISFWAYLLVLLGSFQRIRKLAVGLLLFFVFIFLITLENTTPLHQWLYDHIFFFKFFRNRHFFLPFLTATFSLLAAWHFKNWQETISLLSTRSRKQIALATILLIHGGCVLFLARQPFVPISIFTTIAASAAFFSLSVFRPFFLRTNAGTALLLFLILFHPLKTFWSYTTEAPPVNKSEYITTPRKQPHFYFHRAMEMLSPFWHTITMQDAPGDLSYPDIFLPPWPFKLSKELSDDILKEYTFSKFYLYHDVQPLTPAIGPETLASVLWEKKDVALLSVDSAFSPPGDSFSSLKISLT